MITLIHGTDTASSRKLFMDLKENEQDSLLIDGQNTTLTDLVQIFEGGGLFTEQKNFFIEGLFAKKTRGKGKNIELDAIIDYLKKTEKDSNIFIWEGSELSKSSINAFKNPIIKLFKLPQALFIFLENLKPGNGPILIKLFHEAIQTAEVEMVFFMIVRQVRILLALIEPAADPIDEVKRMAPWQRGKLQNQADFFEIEELKKFYRKLFEIERGLKTGGLSTPLDQTIDFLLLDI